MDGYKSLVIPKYNPFAATNRSCCLSTHCGINFYYTSPEGEEQKKRKCPNCLFSDENILVFEEWDKDGRQIEEIPVEDIPYEYLDDPDGDMEEEED